MDKRFESYDWLKAIGGLLFLVAALLPWWQREYLGSQFRKTAFDDWLGIIATVIFLAIGLLTVLIETESLPIPRWILNPIWVLAAAIVGAACVTVRFFLNPFSGGDIGISDKRGLGLYLAGAAAVISLIGCVMAFQHRKEWAESIDRDEEIADDEDDVDEYGYDDDDGGYDADEQDELIRRINTSMERQPGAPQRSRRSAPRPVTEQERRRAAREQRAAREAPERRRGAAGPPIP